MSDLSAHPVERASHRSLEVAEVISRGITGNLPAHAVTLVSPVEIASRCFGPSNPIFKLVGTNRHAEPIAGWSTRRAASRLRRAVNHLRSGGVRSGGVRSGGAGWNRTIQKRLCRPSPNRLGSAPRGETDSLYLKKYICHRTRQATSCQV